MNIRSFWIQLAAFVLLGVAAPWLVPSSYLFHLLTLAVIWGTLAVSLNLVMGYAGLLSVAHGALAMLGGYASALLVVRLGVPFWITVCVGVLVSAAFGFFLGALTLRLRGHYVAISTLAFGIVVSLVLEKWEHVTFGARGVTGIPAPAPIGPIDFTTNRARYFLALACLALCLVIIRNLVTSRFGRALEAIRENDLVGRSLGIEAVSRKLIAFTISSGLAGLSGILFATYMNYLHPSNANLWTSFFALMYVVIGGSGTIWGPVIGAFFVVMVPEYLRLFDEYRLLLLGVLLIVVTTFFPTGLVGLGKMARRFLVRREATL